MSLHEKLARLLKPYKITAVARMAGLSHQTVCSCLHGQKEPALGTVRKLAGALGVEFGWLVDDARSWPPARVQPNMDLEPQGSAA